jgi:glycosyltransferase involved in cell wall biosynthesis
VLCTRGHNRRYSKVRSFVARLVAVSNVVKQTIEAAPEVVGGRTILTDPRSVEEVSQGFDRLLNVSAEDTEKARAYARKFTWKKCAEETIKVYKKLMFY